MNATYNPPEVGNPPNADVLVTLSASDTKRIPKGYSYDTLKMKFPRRGAEYASGAQSRYFDEVPTIKRSTESNVVRRGRDGSKWILNGQTRSRIRGLSSLVVTDTDVTIEMSAKSLGADYVRGISSANFHDAIRGITPRFMSLDSDVILTSGSLLRCDVVAHIPCDSVEHSLLAMYSNPIQRNVVREMYGRGRAQSVAWRSLLKSTNIRLIAYDKQLEMSRSPKSTRQGLGYDSFAGLLRVETQLRNFKDMRAAHGIPKTTLGAHVMVSTFFNQATNNPITYAMDKMLMPTNETGMTPLLTEILDIKTEGYLRVFERYQWDWQAIWADVLSRYQKGSNPSREKRRVRELFEAFWPEQPKVSEMARIRSHLSEGR